MSEPEQATLVPDPPDVLTSNSGWDTVRHQDFLRDTVAEIRSWGIRTSIFIDPDERRIEFAARTGVDRIELYTESYASTYETDKSRAVAPYVQAAQAARASGLGINAGHDLNLNNLAYFAQSIEGLAEVSIGHALIADALYFGLHNTVQMYLRELRRS